MLTSEEQDIPKYLCCVTHSRLGGSGAPGDLAEMHEATYASWCKGFRFPQNLGRCLLQCRPIFSVFSIILWAHPFSCSQAKMPKELCVGHGNTGAETAKALTAFWCALCHFSWLFSAVLLIFFPFHCSLPAAKSFSFAVAYGCCRHTWRGPMAFKDQPAGDCLQKSCGVQLAPSLFCCTSFLCQPCPLR